jgi:hypothetical protein
MPAPTINVVMMQSAPGENGQIWPRGTTQTASLEFAAFLVRAELATYQAGNLYAPIERLVWRDITSDITVRGTGPTDPSWATYRGNIKQYQFSVNDECWHVFHWPHDWGFATDVLIHAHWSHNSATVASGAVTWGFDVTFAKGFNQGPFPATTNLTVAQTASTTQYQHMVAEVQLSAASPTASQIDTDDLEVDGLLLVRTYLAANTMNGTPEPFLHTVDLHYQSTNVGTKNRAPNFYS